MKKIMASFAFVLALGCAALTYLMGGGGEAPGEFFRAFPDNLLRNETPIAAGGFIAFFMLATVLWRSAKPAARSEG